MAITLDGTAGITTPDLTDSSLTATRVVYAGASGNLTGSANLVFDGSTLTSTTTTAAGVVLDTSTAGKANITLKSAGSQKAIIGLSGAILGTTATDAALFAETGGSIKLFANGAVTNSGTFNQYGFGIGAAVPSSGQGITFPAAQDASSNANTLDDYEEGAWTPALSTTSGSITFSVVSGSYTKVGRLVYVRANFQGTATISSPTGDLKLTSLPFTAASGYQYAGSTAPYNMTTGAYSITVETIAGTTTCYIFNFANGTRSSAHSYIQSGSNLNISLCYEV